MDRKRSRFIRREANSVCREGSVDQSVIFVFLTSPMCMSMATKRVISSTVIAFQVLYIDLGVNGPVAFFIAHTSVA